MIDFKTVVASNKTIMVDDEESAIKYSFSKFTNSGKLSKSDSNYYLIETMPELKERAEKALAQHLTVIESTKADMARALELKAIINDADFNGELVTISSKVSHSKWYQGAGQLNGRSVYLKQVPATVINEAKELQSIRRKHQGNESFDFVTTNYKYIEVREADHDNGR